MRKILFLSTLLAACLPQTPAPAPEPGALRAGIAEARFPSPVGIGTGGYGPFGTLASYTPFAAIYPGTKHVMGHPGVKVIALSRGEGFEAIFVRMDAVGLFAQLRTEIVNRVSAQLGYDVDDILVIGATHTHSGPGRVLNTGNANSGFFNLIVDKFFPEYYERFVATVVDTILAAVADERPATIGTAVSTCDSGHNDRRCEDGETYQNGAMPMLAVARDGQIDALLLAYAIHGTALNNDDLTLSADVSGSIETAVSDRFDHPVMTVMFNSWGADMAPGDPPVATRSAGVRDPKYDRMWRVGSVVADAVEATVPSLTWTDQPDLLLSTHRVAISREILGYGDDEFPYPYGGVYCGDNTGSCEEPGPVEGLDQQCLPFDAAYPAPQQVDVTVGKVGAFSLITFPGEPGTRLAESMQAELRAMDASAGDTLFLGYTQDYLGYSLLEDDWWYGGYEASGALWGPRQGAYLAGQVVDRYGVFIGAREASPEPARLVPFPVPAFTARVSDQAQAVGTIVADVPASVAADGVVTFAVQGSDPWLGTPIARITDADGVAVTRPGGRALTSDQQDFDVTLAVDPPYKATDAAGMARTFTWTFRLSPRSPLAEGLDLSGGTYRIVAELPATTGTTTATSATFSVATAE